MRLDLSPVCSIAAKIDQLAPETIDAYMRVIRWLRLWGQKLCSAIVTTLPHASRTTAPPWRDVCPCYLQKYLYRIADAPLCIICTVNCAYFSSAGYFCRHSVCASSGALVPWCFSGAAIPLQSSWKPWKTVVLYGAVCRISLFS